jgi:hypothetical protein
MNAMKDLDKKNRETEKDPDLDIDIDTDLDEDLDTDLDEDFDEDLEWDPELDMDIDLDIDPRQSEASRYNEEEFLDSDAQVNEKGRDNENRIVN